jgi:catechol 2,3-dioxygenase-like lactoylglutathione lyase family enzyme
MTDRARSAITGVAEVVLNAHDLPAMTAFYRDVLGFRPYSQFPESDPTIVFLTVADLASPLGRGGHGQLFALVDAARHVHTRDAYRGIDSARSTLNHLAFEIDPADFDAEKARLEGLGFAVTAREFPHMQARGMFFRDPEDNLIELICHHPG